MKTKRRNHIYNLNRDYSRFYLKLEEQRKNENAGIKASLAALLIAGLWAYANGQGGLTEFVKQLLK